MDQAPAELAETFADVARALLSEDDVKATLEKITSLAVETIDGCDHAGVGQTKGILMAQQNVNADEAFDILRRASQRMNIKLRELAERVASRIPPGHEGPAWRNAPAVNRARTPRWEAR